MGMIVGMLFLVFGIMGVSGSCSVIVNNHDYETEALIFFTISAIVVAIGILIIIFTIVKKRNEDNLSNLMNTNSNNERKNVCPKCGLNLAEGSYVCPKCGHKLIDKKEV